MVADQWRCWTKEIGHWLHRVQTKAWLDRAESLADRMAGDSEHTYVDSYHLPAQSLNEQPQTKNLYIDEPQTMSLPVRRIISLQEALTIRIPKGRVPPRSSSFKTRWPEKFINDQLRSP